MNYHLLYLWHFLNKEIFYGRLYTPKVLQFSEVEGCYGICEYYPYAQYIDGILLCPKLKKKKLLETLVHEMCHQYEFEVLRTILHTEEHGEKFFLLKDRIKEKLGIRLC